MCFTHAFLLYIATTHETCLLSLAIALSKTNIQVEKIHLFVFIIYLRANEIFAYLRDHRIFCNPLRYR